MCILAYHTKGEPRRDGVAFLISGYSDPVAVAVVSASPLFPSASLPFTPGGVQVHQCVVRARVHTYTR